MKVYSVTIKAFGRVLVTNVLAKDEEDALFRAQQAVGYEASVHETSLDPSLHTGSAWG